MPRLLALAVLAVALLAVGVTARRPDPECLMECTREYRFCALDCKEDACFTRCEMENQKTCVPMCSGATSVESSSVSVQPVTCCDFSAECMACKKADNGFNWCMNQCGTDSECQSWCHSDAERTCPSCKYTGVSTPRHSSSASVSSSRVGDSAWFTCYQAAAKTQEGCSMTCTSEACMSACSAVFQRTWTQCPLPTADPIACAETCDAMVGGCQSGNSWCHTACIPRCRPHYDLCLNMCHKASFPNTPL